MALDQANENNSVSSSAGTARNLRAYEPLYAGSLYDFPRSMIDRDHEDIHDEDDYYYEEVENRNGSFDYRTAADRLIHYAPYDHEEDDDHDEERDDLDADDEDNYENYENPNGDDEDYQ